MCAYLGIWSKNLGEAVTKGPVWGISWFHSRILTVLQISVCCLWKTGLTASSKATTWSCSTLSDTEYWASGIVYVLRKINLHISVTIWKCPNDHTPREVKVSTETFIWMVFSLKRYGVHMLVLQNMTFWAHLDLCNTDIDIGQVHLSYYFCGASPKMIVQQCGGAARWHYYMKQCRLTLFI